MEKAGQCRVTEQDPTSLLNGAFKQCPGENDRVPWDYQQSFRARVLFLGRERPHYTRAYFLQQKEVYCTCSFQFQDKYRSHINVTQKTKLQTCNNSYKRLTTQHVQMNTDKTTHYLENTQKKYHTYLITMTQKY